MRQILVTGGAGFIGSHLVDSLLADGFNVTVVDNFDPFYPRHVKLQNIAQHLGHSNYRLVECDLRDSGRMALMLADDYDCIVHLAAKAGIRRSFETPAAYQEVNVVGTQNLLDLAKVRKVPQFVFGSSSSIYGVNQRVPWREDDLELLPISPYAASKIAAESLGHVYSYLYGTRFLALRFFTVYGPRQRPDLAIHAFTRALQEGTPISLFGDGSTRRDYTFVDDIVSGIRAAMDYRGSRYEAINLGSGCPVRLDDLIHELERAFGMRARLDHQVEQEGDVPQTYADCSKAAKLLAFRCQTTLGQGLRSFAHWYRQRDRVAIGG